MSKYFARTFVLTFVSVILGFALALITRDAGLLAAYASVVTASGGIYATKRYLENKNATPSKST